MLLENVKKIKFIANSDINKDGKSCNSGLGERNGKEKCNTGKQIA